MVHFFKNWLNKKGTKKEIEITAGVILTEPLFGRELGETTP